MDQYILKRLREGARHVLAQAELEGDLTHPGFKGRLRELLIHDLLIPWLPPYVSCGTGVIIDGDSSPDRKHTQDDIIVYDKTLVPPILASEDAPEGVFLFNGVLLRIEVKSRLDRQAVKGFVESCREIMSLKLKTKAALTRNLFGAFNMLFAYSTDLTDPDPNSDYDRLIEVLNEEGVDPMSGAVSALCVPGRGLWMPIPGGHWQRLKTTDALNHLAWFIAVVSNSCFDQHVRRQARDPDQSIDGGIGHYIPGDFSVWETLA